MLELKLASLKKNGVFMKHLRFDVTPEILLKPRFLTSENRERLIGEIQGFTFYVDYLEGMPKPVLMVLKTYCLNSKSIAEITDAPEDLLWETVRSPEAKTKNGMYAPGPSLEKWIKEELELEAKKS
jgi:hypothetical protein